MERLTRRSFVSGAAAVGAIAAVSAQSVHPALASTSETIDWDDECDVLVCGYGASGAACAIEAADQGANVLIIEKAALPGGSMARCGGAIMGSGTRVQKELGVDDDPDKLYEWVKTCVNQHYELCPDDIIRTYADHAGENVDWLMDMCEQYCGRDLFDVAMAVENEGAKDNSATGDNGNGVTSGCLNAVGCEYDKFGVSKEEAVPRSHWAYSPGGAPNSGPELFDPLHENISAKQKDGLIRVEYKTALKSIVRDEAGIAVGVIAADENGETRIKARNGIMLATGGFCAADDMKMRFCQEALGYTTYMCYDCTGDGIKAAMEIGADLTNMCNFYPIEVAQVYQYDTKYNDVYNSWLNMDETGTMNVPAHNMAECHGGVRINADAQVIGVDGNVIPHLYASGNDVGTNIWGVPGNYPGCGCYVSFSIAFGRIAGANLATEQEGVVKDTKPSPYTADDVVLFDVTDGEAQADSAKIDFSTATLADGTYTGNGQGRGGNIGVTLTVKDGKITVDEITQDGETQGIGGYEAINDGTFAKQIETAQGSDIDGIAGATQTTNGVKEAVEDALSQAVK